MAKKNNALRRRTAAKRPADRGDKVVIRLHPEERAALDAAAAREEVPAAVLARRALRKYLGLPPAGAVHPITGRPPRPRA